jgi:PIN domain nuclease of toxin-antitoxin system
MPRPKGRTSTGPFVLDTHVWIWLMEGLKSELSDATVRVIEEAGSRSELALAAISVWELGMLEAGSRITLSRSIDEWVRVALTAPGLRLVDLTPEVAVESTRLPGGPHGDPADRMIIATTRVLGGTLITCDEQILAYGAGGHLSVRDGKAKS